MTQLIGILAAGTSSRMRGRDKLLEDVGGEPLLQRQLRIARDTGVPVLVALPPGDGPRQSLARRAGATLLTVEADPPGMGDSIAALAAEAERMGATALLLHLADMPEITAEDLRALLSAATDDTVIRAGSQDGRPGHPVVFPRACFADLRRLSGDRGARDVLARLPVRVLPLRGARAHTDLDTPEAWASWRRKPK